MLRWRYYCMVVKMSEERSASSFRCSSSNGLPSLSEFPAKYKRCREFITSSNMSHLTDDGLIDGGLQ
jgi:hypothetical protein